MVFPRLCAAAFALALAAVPASADTFQFQFAGTGVSGTIALTYGTATDAKYPQAYEVTGASGTFTDTNAGLSNAAVLGVIPVNHATPETGNLLPPADFSRFVVESGLAEGGLTFDNLFWPLGSPQTATSYPPHGGFTDIYGILFDLGNGRVLDFWSNGVFAPGADPDYALTVATSAVALDQVPTGVTITPEPGTLCLLGTGMLAMATEVRRRLR